MIFVDGIALTQKFKHDSINVLAGVRRISFREVGDIDYYGNVVDEQEVLGETLTSAWIQGSHDTKLQLRSDGSTLSIKGNPGRWNRAENLFNLDLDSTIKKVNDIVIKQGFPKNAFRRGNRDPYTESQLSTLDFAEGDLPEDPWNGSRIWTIHLTQNYRTGSQDNAKAVIDWLNTQSVARVKKSRLGATTIVWGDIRYCQTECYIKSDEMLAHCKTPESRAIMKESKAYKYVRENGVIRLEVKCAKAFLKHRKLTYLGNWNMGTVIELFKEKEEILMRCALNKATEDTEILDALPLSTRVHAAAWMAGVDVSTLMSKATFYRHAKILRQYGIDIAEPRNVTVLKPKMREIIIEPLAMPDWYDLEAPKLA